MKINQIFKEEFRYKVEKRSIILAPTFTGKELKAAELGESYGLFAAEHIPAMRIVGTFEPISTFKCSQKDFGTHNLLWADSLHQEISGELLGNKEEKKADEEKEVGEGKQKRDREKKGEGKEKLIAALNLLAPRNISDEPEEDGKCHEYWKLFWKLATNCFASGEYVCALFLTPSFINHSCNPNCNFDGENGLLYSLREICSGEELSISYTFEENFTKQRAALKNTWHFDCSCGWCTRETARLDSPLTPPQDDGEKNTYYYLFSSLTAACHQCAKPDDPAAETPCCDECEMAIYCSDRCQSQHQETHQHLCYFNKVILNQCFPFPSSVSK